MQPGEVIALLAVLIIGAGTLVSLTAMWLKHRQHMAGLTGKKGDLRQTVQLLTETLERQHDRQQAILTRLDALEAERDAPRLALPDADEALLADARPRTARVGVR